MAGVDRGCLVVADISGYTRFLRGVELQHSSDVLADLIGVVVDQLSGVTMLAKLEGDAAFCFERSQCNGPALMTAMASCYGAFRRRIRDITHLTTCECAACREIPRLDLKMVVHYGEFVVHKVAGSEELIGPDVILVHRLLKNTVTATTGMVAYVLMTAAAIDALAINADEIGLMARTEPTDDLGDVDAFLLDLTAQWLAEEARSAVVVGDDAMYSVVFDLPAPPPVVWDWFADPVKRIKWNKADRIDVEDPNVVGVGNVSHCVHGKMKLDEEIVDWKPYRYCTIRVATPAEHHLMMVNIEPTETGSRVDFRFRAEGNAIRRALFRAMFTRVMRKELTAGMSRMADLVSAPVSQPA